MFAQMLTRIAKQIASYYSQRRESDKITRIEIIEREPGVTGIIVDVNDTDYDTWEWRETGNTGWKGWVLAEDRQPIPDEEAAVA